MTTETRVDRDKLAAGLEDLARAHQELQAPLQADLQAAQAAHAEAVEALKGATNVAGAAQVACTAEARQHERQRAPIEATLRDGAAARLGEFRAFCVQLKDDMRDKASLAKGDELRALQARSSVALDAIREIERLGLLGDDALDERLARLRVEIEGGEGSGTPEHAREAVAAS